MLKTKHLKNIEDLALTLDYADLKDLYHTIGTELHERDPQYQQYISGFINNGREL